MTMSRDRVQFFLPPICFQRQRGSNGTHIQTMIKILCLAFGGHDTGWGYILEDNPHGVMFNCRPSQFARFIVHRCELGEGINGIRNLKPRIVDGGEGCITTREAAIADRLPGYLTTCGYEKIVRYVLSATAEVDRDRESNKVLDVSTREAVFNLTGTRS